MKLTSGSALSAALAPAAPFSFGALASIALALASAHCGPLVNDPVDAGKGSTTGTTGSSGASATGSSGASATGSTGSAGTAGTTGTMDDGAVSGTSGDSTGGDSSTSGSTSGSGASGEADGTAPMPETGASGSTSGSGSDAASGNLVTNGDFSQGNAAWGISSGTATIGVTNGELCVSAGSGSIVLGWPQAPATALMLTSGSSYEFSYGARTMQGNLMVEAKVANSMSSTNYMPVDSDSMDAVTSTAKTFTHSFTPSTTDPSAGIAFIFSLGNGQQACFTNVSLIPK
jgi:hypothetical protein